MSLPVSLVIILSYLMALLAMAFYTLLERKLLGYFQLRKGPNKIALAGLPQPLADALKLFLKEHTPPASANLGPYALAPVLGLSLALILWALYPMSFPAFFIPYGALFFFCLSSMNVYPTLAAGWFSNSKYALLGALRGVAQTISYEVSLALIFISPLILHSSFDFSVILFSSMVPKMFLLPPLIIMWFISILAETNRTPFDFAEGESELVSGFNVEYSAGMFALIFMAEYANILFMSLLTAGIFLSSSVIAPFVCPVLSSFTLYLAVIFVWVRATFPRLRYDQLMTLTWKIFLPVALGALLLCHTASSLLFL